MPPLPAHLVRWSVTPASELAMSDVERDPVRGVVLRTGANNGSVTGQPHAIRWLQAIPSWHADTPAGTVIEVLVRARIGTRWTRWYDLGHWSSDAALRHSVNNQHDADGSVATDTLHLQRMADALQWRVVLRGTADASPALRTLAFAVSPLPDASLIESDPMPVAPLAVPPLSQMGYPGGGPVWCSPTSLTMVFAYWYAQTHDPQLARFGDPQSVPDVVAPAVYDAVYDGTGNWAFNAAYVAGLGLESYVVQFHSLADVAQWLVAAVPVIASIGWRDGELDGAPLEHSNGHLVVIIGLTADGDIIVNDPAAHLDRGEPVQRVYRRDQFLRAWDHSGRAVYLICPADRITEAAHVAVSKGG